MRLLLDTHIFLWSILEPERLSSRVIAELEDPENELWFSVISAWEIAILIEKKRIILSSSERPTAWIRNALSRSPLKEAPINTEIALVSRELKIAHQDPADRFIAATARVHDLILITADKHLLRMRSIQTMANH